MYKFQVGDVVKITCHGFQTRIGVINDIFLTNEKFPYSVLIDENNDVGIPFTAYVFGEDEMELYS